MHVTTTRDFLTSLSRTMRGAKYDSIDCCNHLAMRGNRDGALKFREMARFLDELADAVWEEAEKYE